MTEFPVWVTLPCQASLWKAPVMKSTPAVPNTIEEYIAARTPEVQKLLQKVRRTIRKAAPGAEEKISYQLPTYALHGNLVHFGAFSKHIGFYPGADGIKAFQDELAAYTTSTGTIQFPFDEPLPLALITRIVKFRVKQNLDKLAAKQTH